MSWNKISGKIDQVINVIGSLMVLTTIVCTTINIFSRWIIGRSLGQLDELSLIAFVWAIYVGVGMLYNRGEHICMDFIILRLPYKPRVVLTILNTMIELVLSVLVTVLTVMLMSRSFIRTTNVNHIPYAFLQLSIGIGFGLLVLSLIAKMIRIFSGLAKKQDIFADTENPYAIEEGGEE